MCLQEQIAEEFNECIAAARVTHPIVFTGKDIAITNNLITTAGTFRTDLPDLSLFFFENCFPQNPWTEYHHFTKLRAFENIIATRSIHLSAVYKRFKAPEFSTFYNDHEMNGYKKRIAAGVSMEVGLVKDAFFWSLACGYVDTAEEEKLWDTFAGDKGVRLVFSIADIHTDFRQIYYRGATKNIPVLNAMMGVANRHDRFLFFNGLSKVGFFYLLGTFQSENEIRLLIKRKQAISHGLSITPHPDGYDYLNLPFESLLVTIKLTKVIPGKSCNIDKVRKILNSRPGFEAVEILG